MNSDSAKAKAAPALTPRTSGLAISLPVSRCRMKPATATIAPAAAAAMRRGARQGRISAQASGGRICQAPLASRPRKRTATRERARLTQRASLRAGEKRAAACGTEASKGGRTLARRRGSRKSSSGEPKIAVTAPVGRNSAETPDSSVTVQSVASRSSAPMMLDQTSRSPNCRAPASRARIGATRPMKPMTPTALVTKPARSTARPIAPILIRVTFRPSEATLASPSSRSDSGRTSSHAGTTRTASRIARSMVGCQLCCASEPAPQMNRLTR